MESEVNNIGQRKKLNYNTVSMKVSVDPIQNSGAGLTLQVYLVLSKSDQDFIPPGQPGCFWRESDIGQSCSIQLKSIHTKGLS